MASKDGASGSSASFDLNQVGDAVDNVGVGFDEYFGVKLDFSGQKAQGFSFREVLSSSGSGKLHGFSSREVSNISAGQSGEKIVIGGDGFRVGEVEVPKKRGRGRPRKTDTAKTPDSIGKSSKKGGGGSSVNSAITVIPDRIGRFSDEVGVYGDIANGEGSSSMKRGRGRPRKSVTTKTPTSIGSAVVVYGDGIKETDWCVDVSGGVEIGAAADGVVRVEEEISSKKRGRGRPRKSDTMKMPDGISRFADKAADYDVTHEFGSSVVSRVVAVTDDIVCFKVGRGSPLESASTKTPDNISKLDVVVYGDATKEIGSSVVGSGAGSADGESSKKRGRGRPPKSATAKTPDSNGRFHEKVAVANSANTTTQDGHGIFDDEVVVTEGINDKTGLGVASNGVSSPDATVQVKEEDTPKKRGRGRPPKSVTVEIQDNKGRFDVDMMVKKDETKEIGSMVSVNGVSAVDGSVDVVEEGTPKKRGRGRPPKSVANRTQDKSLPIIVQGNLEKRKREGLDPIVFEDYDPDSSDSEQMEVSSRKRWRRSQLGDEENTQERDATAEEQKTSYRRRGRPRREIIDSTKQASYSFPFQDEKKFGFAAYDLVWGKARRPLWWPGQIFDASLASKMTLDFPKDGQLLLAYFGDNTLAWCDKSELVSFQSNFPQMAEQKGMDTFETAVGAALEDVSKRVQFSMICSCYRSGDYASRLNQKLRNSGITEGACGSAANRSWIVDTFDPIKFIKYLHALAESSSEGANRLDLAIVNAQLDAFHHSKGYLERPVLMGEELVNKDKGLRPRKCKFDKDSSSNSHLSSKRHKDAHLETNSLYTTHKRLPNVGELLYHVAGKMAGSGGENLKKCSTKRNQVADYISDQLSGAQISRATNSDYPACKELLLDLCLVATDPLNEPTFVGRIVDYFSAFRNCLVTSSKDEKPLYISSELATITTGTAQDSHWNDIIISDAEEELTSEVQQGKGECQTRTEERRKIVEEPVSVSDPSGPKLSSPGAIQLEPRRPLISLPEAEECMPTELFLTFGDSYSLPSIADLVQIFGRYGALREAETNVIESLKFAKVVFKKRSDAEIAEADLRGPGEYSLFGQACTGYRLDPAGPMESNPSPVQRLEPKRPRIKLQDGEECIPTELVLTFGDSYTLPSVADLVKICSQYGPLREVETEVVEDLKIARVVFKRHTDAEIARSVLSGAGKYSFFRQAPVIGCKLKNLESTLQNFYLQDQPSKWCFNC